jgi:radical SAM enzyme (TIGR01210 family)
LKDEAVGCLTIILRTRGCRWNRCLMCGFASEGAPATAEDLMIQFRKALQSLQEDDQMVKIYTSGSFFDTSEVPESVRNQILTTLGEKSRIRKVVLESRPEYISADLIQKCVSYVPIEVAFGLETANDLIREHAICKGFSFEAFRKASKIVHKHDGTVKAYLLLKPPFLSEGMAISDILNSADKVSRYADILSLNLCNVQRGTVVERMWRHGEYRPPWLWSAVDVLKKVSMPIICDPLAAGAKRGPHNCGKCDKSISQAIKEHALWQDPSIFESLDCSCLAAWEKIVELEDSAFGSTLA